MWGELENSCILMGTLFRQLPDDVAVITQRRGHKEWMTCHVSITCTCIFSIGAWCQRSSHADPVHGK